VGLGNVESMEENIDLSPPAIYVSELLLK